MGRVITTKDCVSAIVAQIPSVLPGLSNTADAGANGWRRYHKSGRAGAVILRRFHATHLPLLAEVTEHPGGQLVASILPMWEWNQSLYGVSDDLDTDLYYHGEILALMLQHVRASDFAFAVGEDPDMGVYINLCPLEFFRREGHLWDSHLGAIVDLMALPFPLGEEMEAVFSINDSQPRTGAEVILAMSGAGFSVDNDFIRFVNECAG